MKKKSMLDLHRITAAQFKQAPKMPVVVVLDDVRSEMNVGSVFRTADAFVVERIALCGITAVPPMPEIHKTALGAECSVEWQHYATALEAVQQLRSEGYTICTIEQVHGSVRLERYNMERGRCQRLLHRAAPARHQAQPQHRQHRRHRDVAIF